MACVTGAHRAAVRLRHITDQKTVPDSGVVHLKSEVLEEADQCRVAPIAVARQPHNLPSRSADGKRGATGETAGRVEPDGARLQVGRSWFAREEFPGGCF